MLLLLLVFSISDELLSSNGLLEYGLRLNTGDGVKLMVLGDGISKFKLLLFRLAIVVMELGVFGNNEPLLNDDVAFAFVYINELGE